MTRPFTGMAKVTTILLGILRWLIWARGWPTASPQGSRIADEFRTAPLWGVDTTVLPHDVGPPTSARPSKRTPIKIIPLRRCADLPGFRFSGGFEFQPFSGNQSLQVEANTVIDNFTCAQRFATDDVLNFLRSLTRVPSLKRDKTARTPPVESRLRQAADLPAAKRRKEEEIL